MSAAEDFVTQAFDNFEGDNDNYGVPVALIIEIALLAMKIAMDYCDDEDDILARSRNPRLFDKVKFLRLIMQLLRESDANKVGLASDIMNTLRKELGKIQDPQAKAVIRDIKQEEDWVLI